MAPRGAPSIDILVLTPDEQIIATIQVKTRTHGRDKGWHMKSHHEALAAPRMFYAFVDLEPDEPVTYIVPSATVTEVLTRSHLVWLSTPGRAGRAHRDHAMRRLLPSYSFPVKGYPARWLDAFRERWSLITEAASPAADPQWETASLAGSRRPD